jgi:hypothetical protein
MPDSRRDQFITRVSTVGWGTRESIQVMLGAVVSDVREGVVRGKYGEAELDAVVDFHDRAEVLWRETIASDPPIAIDRLTIQLRELVRACRDDPALAEFELKLGRGLRDAEALEQTRKT